MGVHQSDSEKSAQREFIPGKPHSVPQCDGEIQNVADDADENTEAEGGVGETTDDDAKSSQHSVYLLDEDTVHPRMLLPRLPTCAVFHKLTSGRGSPHSFYSFVRLWPALPRLVVSDRASSRLLLRSTS